MSSIDKIKTIVDDEKEASFLDGLSMGYQAARLIGMWYGMNHQLKEPESAETLARWTDDELAKLQSRLDTPDAAYRDRRITKCEYKAGKFRRFFTTVRNDERLESYIGKEFKTIRTLNPQSEGKQDDMYLIRFNDGHQWHVEGREVCVIDYNRCIFGN